MVLNLYSNGYSALLADTAVRTAFGFKEVKVMDDPLGPKSVAPGETHLGFGELVLRDKFGKAIPLSVFSRLVR